MVKIIKQEKCLWCEGRKLTSEHIWGDWAVAASRAELGNNPKVFHQVRRESEQREIALSAAKIDKGKFSINGVPANIKRRLVCRRCNNGWMSRVENDAKSLVLKVGKSSFDQWTSDELNVLARWCVQKTFLFTFCELLAHPSLLAEPEPVQQAFVQSCVPESLAVGIIPSSYTIAVCAITPAAHGMNNLYYRIRNVQPAIVDFAMFGAIRNLGFWASSTEHGRLELRKLQHRSNGAIQVIYPFVAPSRAELNVYFLTLDSAQRQLRRIIDYPVDFISNKFEMHRRGRK